MMMHCMPGLSSIGPATSRRPFLPSPHQKPRLHPVHAIEQRSNTDRTMPKKMKPLTQVVPIMFLAGATLGPLLDGIHGTVELLTYKVGAYDIGGLHSSLWVSPLLGAYYAILGPLHLTLDSLATQGTSAEDGAENDATYPSFLQPLVTPVRAFLADGGNPEKTVALASYKNWPAVVLNLGVLALSLEISAILYKFNVPHAYISAALSILAVQSMRSFDSTRQGFVLAVFCGVAAPLSELVLINVFGLWQYPHPNVFGPGGVPSWVFWCYFLYTSGVGNLARFLSKND